MTDPRIPGAPGAPAATTAASAAPTRIVAIRHGETAWNADGRLQGQLDLPLNPRGRAQAERLAAALADEGLAAVVASDLSRAWETARALAVPLGLPLHASPGLRERCFGCFEGLTRDELAARWPETYARWQRREPDFAPEGAETLRDFSARCMAAAADAARQHAGGAVALVCHGGVLDCLYRAATGVALDAPRTWQLGNAAIHRLLFAEDRFTLVGWNDDQHLDGIARDEVAG